MTLIRKTCMCKRFSYFDIVHMLKNQQKHDVNHAKPIHTYQLGNHIRLWQFFQWTVSDSHLKVLQLRRNSLLVQVGVQGLGHGGEEFLPEIRISMCVTESIFSPKGTENLMSICFFVLKAMKCKRSNALVICKHGPLSPGV